MLSFVLQWMRVSIGVQWNSFTASLHPLLFTSKLKKRLQKVSYLSCPLLSVANHIYLALNLSFNIIKDVHSCMYGHVNCGSVLVYGTQEPIQKT